MKDHNWEIIETRGGFKRKVNPNEPIAYATKTYFVLTRAAFELLGKPDSVALVKDANFLGFMTGGKIPVRPNGNTTATFRIPCKQFIDDYKLNKPGMYWDVALNTRGNVIFFDCLEPKRI